MYQTLPYIIIQVEKHKERCLSVGNCLYKLWCIDTMRESHSREWIRTVFVNWEECFTGQRKVCITRFSFYKTRFACAHIFKINWGLCICIVHTSILCVFVYVCSVCVGIPKYEDKYRRCEDLDINMFYLKGHWYGIQVEKKERKEGSRQVQKQNKCKPALRKYYIWFSSIFVYCVKVYVCKGYI